MNEPIQADDKPYATFVFNHEGRQYVAREDYEWLRAEANKQAKQIADAAYRLQGFPAGSPGYEAHAILCGEPPEVT